MRRQPVISFRHLRALFYLVIVLLLAVIGYFGSRQRNPQQAYELYSNSPKLKTGFGDTHVFLSGLNKGAAAGPKNLSAVVQHHPQLLYNSGQLRKKKRSYDPNKNTNLATATTISKIRGMSVNNSACLKNLMEGNGPWMRSFTAAAHRLNRGGSVVLTGGDWNYRGVLMNWMAMMDRINVTEYIVFCYDDRLLSIVGAWESGGHGILTPNCSSIQEFMYLKLVGVNALIHAGYTATWSDCDCVWLRPFLDEWVLPHGSSYDVVGQRALHPRSISNVTGAVLCTGLFTVFPTERSLSLFERVVESLPSYSNVISDQSVLNEVLDASGAYAAAQRFEYQDRSLDLTQPQPTGAAAPRLGLLPYHVFPRPASNKQYLAIAKSNEWGNTLAVWHIRVSKVASEKLLEMYNSYVLAISMDWAAVENRAAYKSVVDYSGVRIPRLSQRTLPRLIADPLPNVSMATDVTARINAELRKNLEKILQAKNKTAK